MITSEIKSRRGYVIVGALTGLLSGSVFIHAFMTRILGLTMVCMLAPGTSGKNGSEIITGIDNCGRNYSINETAETLGYTGTFTWTKFQQSNIIAAHNWARLALLPFSGLIIKIGNPPQIFALATFVCILMTALFPTASIKGGWVGALLIRITLGTAHAFSSPSLDHIVATSTPKSWRSIIYAVITSGSQVAIMLGDPLGAFFCSHSLFGGWPAIYYTASMAAGLWIILWEVMHGLMHLQRRREMCHIVVDPDESDESRLLSADGFGEDEINEEQQPSVPASAPNKVTLRGIWDNIIMEPAIWALYPCNIAATWKITLLVYYVPQFYRDVLKVSLVQNGYLSALLFLTLMITKLIFSTLADWLKNATSISHSVISKVFNTVGIAGSGIFVLLCTRIPCLPTGAAIGLLCIGAGLYSATTPGFRVTLVSINRDWTSVISAACTIVAMIGGITFPYLVSGIVKHGTKTEWNTLFILMSAVDFLAALAYNFLGTVKNRQEQYYDRRNPSENDRTN